MRCLRKRTERKNLRVYRLARRRNRYPAHSLRSVEGLLKKGLSYAPEIPQFPVGHQEKDVIIGAERLPPIVYRREKDGS